MGIVKVLKRKDGASLVVGVTVGLLVVNLVAGLTNQLTQKIVNIGSDSVAISSGWRVAYLQPIVTFLLELIALELLIWIYAAVHEAVKK